MPKVVDVEATKMRIVRATWAIITKKGIQSVSMRRVASAAGCTTGLITHHFSDKDELVTHAYKVVLDRMIADATFRVTQESSVREKLLAAVEAIEPSAPEMKEFTIVLINFWAQAAFNDTFAARCRHDYKRWRRLIARTIRHGIDAGELRTNTDVRALTDTITLLSDGLSVGMTLTPAVYPRSHRHTILNSLLQPYLRQ
jgi:TetR/AcrR family transcriptional regulator, transcriptional repressor of bet genes